jgi:hypothetical protein
MAFGILKLYLCGWLFAHAPVLEFRYKRWWQCISHAVEKVSSIPGVPAR